MLTSHNEISINLISIHTAQYKPTLHMKYDRNVNVLYTDCEDMYHGNILT
jgi:hypothetical protein